MHLSRVYYVKFTLYVTHLSENIYVVAENPEERPICNVNGKIYKDGEYFNVESDPDLNCVCQEGYKGKDDFMYYFQLFRIFQYINYFALTVLYKIY